jgi:hypothetical protein
MGWCGLDWSWLRVGTGGQLLWIWYWTFWFHKVLGKYWVASQLVASRVVLGSIWFRDGEQIQVHCPLTSLWISCREYLESYTSRWISGLAMYVWYGDVTVSGTRVLRIDRDLDRDGVAEGVTMALLALEMGLIDLPMPQRMGAMCMILFIVVGSLIQSMHEIVEPVLLALSASHSPSILRHVQVLVMCLFLLVSPLYMTVFLCRVFDVDFWMLVVISTCTLTSVQVCTFFYLISLVLKSLKCLGSLLRQISC